MEGAGRGRGQLRHPPDHKGADWSTAFLAAKAKLSMLTTNGQGKKERINSRFAPRLDISQRDNANGSTMDVVAGVKGEILRWGGRAIPGIPREAEKPRTEASNTGTS